MSLLSVVANSYAADGALEGWTDPTNAYANDSVYATRTGAAKNVAGGNLFGFDLSSLPDTATINSVTVSAEWHNSTADTAGPVLTLGTKSGGATSGFLNDTSGQTTDEVHTYSPTGMTVAQLKATGDYGFWAVLRFYRTDNTAHTAYVDYVKCEVDYTDSAGEILGAANSTLDGIGGSATGAVAVAATSAITLDELAGAGQGAVIVTGEASNTFSSLSSGATGLVGIVGSASKAFDALIGEIIGIVGNAPATGVLESMFGNLTGQGIGAVLVTGQGGAQLAGIGAVMTGRLADIYSLQPCSPRIIGAPCVTPIKAAVSSAGKSAKRDYLKVEGD